MNALFRRSANNATHVCRLRVSKDVALCSAFILATSCAASCNDPASPNGAADRILWSVSLPAFTGVTGVSAVTDQDVYAATDSGLAAVDPTTGEVRWFARVTGLAGSKRIVVRNAKVFTAGTYAVRAHDPATGAIIWEKTYDPNLSAPDFSEIAADDQALYVGLRDGRALALAQ